MPQAPSIWEWEFEAWIDVDLNCLNANDLEAPETVQAATRLRDNINTLQILTEGDAPAEQRCRVSGLKCVNYLLGNTCGKVFKSVKCDEQGGDAQTGCWLEECQWQLSNWREAKNLVPRIAEMDKEGSLKDREEIFIFTDNIVFERTFYKGHSTSPLLNNIILDLIVLEKRSCCILHGIHVAEMRMERSRIDGLLRGDFFEGIMADHDPLFYAGEGKSKGMGRIMVEQRIQHTMVWRRT